MINDPAFPTIDSINIHQQSDSAGEVYSSGGLTKRELFAAMAMQGLLSNNERTDVSQVEEV
jgi:hypothetical protein